MKQTIPQFECLKIFKQRWKQFQHQKNKYLFLQKLIEMKMNSSYNTPKPQKKVTFHAYDPKDIGMKAQDNNTSGKRFMRKSNASIDKKVNCSNDNFSSTQNLFKRSEQFLPTSTNIHTISPSYVKISNLLQFPSTPKGQRSALERDKCQTLRDQSQKESNAVNFHKGFKVSEAKENFSPLNQTSFSSNILNPHMKSSVAIMKTELELKEKQVLQLEEEQRRAKNVIEDLRKKESKISQEYLSYRKKTDNIHRNLQNQIQSLSKHLDEQNIKIGELNATNKKLTDQLKLLNIDNEYLKQQFTNLARRKLPKNVIQMQSWRELSLEKQLNQLKINSVKSKTKVEEELEDLAKKLQLQNHQLRQHVKSLQLVERIMMKKTEDSTKYLDAYIGMKNQYQSARFALKSYREQCQYLRQQNVRLKKQLLKYSKGPIKNNEKVHSLLELSSVQSLNLSANSRQ